MIDIDKTVKEVSENLQNSSSGTLKLVQVAKCSTTRARMNRIILQGESRDQPQEVNTPVFMPVGTQGAMKGITTQQMRDMFDCRIFLGNTYHLGHRPGPEIMEKAGGLHKFMKWQRGLLTDSGGFQMVSLAKLSSVAEDGVHFTSPHDGSSMLLTPEHSMFIQNSIGADIMMQLDDVVPALTEDGNRVEQAMYRSVRWLDRCIEAHKRPQDQALFAIVQGGLGDGMRARCLELMKKRTHLLGGFAVGGLSGGEDKWSFWHAVELCCRPESGLPSERPRYVMGVGYSLDILVCVALGADMFDCVYPTRTGRFGCALVPSGQLQLHNARFRCDFKPVQEDCTCVACTTPYSRAYLHSISNTPTFASLISLHNVAYMLDFMRQMQAAIVADVFPQFCVDFFARQYSDRADYPQWAVSALALVGVEL